jgi:proline racemase
MNIKSLTMATAGLAMIAAPVAAIAAPANSASSLSVTKSVRAGTAANGKSKLAGRASIVPIIIGVGLVAGVAYLVIDHEDKDDNSDSN